MDYYEVKNGMFKKLYFEKDEITDDIYFILASELFYYLVMTIENFQFEDIDKEFEKALSINKDLDNEGSLLNKEENICFLIIVQ